MPIKGLDFSWSGKYLVSGSTDFTYDFMLNEKPSGWLGTITKLWAVALLLIFVG